MSKPDNFMCLQRPNPLDPDTLRGKLLAYSFLNTVDPCEREVWAYLRRHEVDLDTIEAAGPIGRFRVALDEFGYFERNNSGEDALIHIVHDEDSETPLDLVGWSMIRPHLFGTYRGEGALLGADQLSKPRCPLWQTPLAWLRSGCRGACILDHERAVAIICKAPGPFVAQSIAHAHELIRLLPDVFGARGRLLVQKRAVA